MKLIILAALTVIASNSFAKTTKKDCSLFILNPRITHTMYGENTANNKVNNGVLSILTKNGFSISTNASKAKYSMETEVRCAKGWTMFGLQDTCQTEVTFVDNVEEKIVYTDGPTSPIMGLNIDYNNINFPKCSDL